MKRHGLLALAVGVLLAVPLFPLGEPGALVGDALQGPSLRYPLGTDPFGRDLGLRLLWAAHRAVANALAITGLVLGGSGMMGLGYALSPVVVRRVLSQVTLTVLAVPPLLLAVAVLVTVPGSGVIAVSLGLLPVVGRYVNTLVEQALTAPYTRAARLNGASRLRAAVEHIVPQVAVRMAGFGVVIFVWGIVGLTSLEFLGLVGSPSDASIGRMIDEGRQVLAQTPRPVLAPTLVLFVLALLGGARPRST